MHTLCNEVESNDQLREGTVQSEDFFASLVEQVDDVVWAVAYPELQLEYLNPAAAAVFGRSVQAFMADDRLWLAIVHSEDRDAVAASYDALLQQDHVERRYRILTPDGEQRWIHDRAWLMRDADGEPRRLFGIARDVTLEVVERQQLDSTLKLQWRFIESAPDPIFLVSVLADGSFRFRYNNPAHRQLTGVSLEMLCGQTPDSLLEASQAAAVTAHYRDCVRLRRSLQYEERLALPAGWRDWQTQLVPMEDIDGNVVELVGIARDVTPLKEAERQSRDAFEALDQMLQAIPVVIYECQATPELIPSYVSSSVEWLFGYRSEDILDRPVWQTMLHPDDAPLVMSKLTAMLAGEGPVQLHYRLRHRDGHYLQVQSEKRLICDEAGQPLKVVGAMLDTTASFQLSQRLEKLAHQLSGCVFQYQLTAHGQGFFPYASRRSLAIFQASPETLAHSDAAACDALHPDDRPAVKAAIERSAAALTPWQCEFRILQPHGQALWVEGNAMPEPLEDGSVLWHGYIDDVSERKRLQLELEASEARFRHLASVDMLTGAPNRRRFMECLDAELVRVSRHGLEACLVMLDVDHFKRVNDTFGHAVGDEVLKALVRSGRDHLRAPDTLGRLGGEEFALLLPDTSLSGALALAERLRRAIAELEVTFGNACVRVTVSMGVAALRAQETSDSALERADRALYRAKALGRNRICSESDAVGSATIE